SSLLGYRPSLRFLAYLRPCTGAPHPSPLPEGRALRPSADTVAEEGIGASALYSAAFSITACSKTSQPAATFSGVASSISLWLMPSLQGMKIIAEGQTCARYLAS